MYVLKSLVFDASSLSLLCLSFCLFFSFEFVSLIFCVWFRLFFAVCLCLSLLVFLCLSLSLSLSFFCLALCFSVSLAPSCFSSVFLLSHFFLSIRPQLVVGQRKSLEGIRKRARMLPQRARVAVHSAGASMVWSFLCFAWLASAVSLWQASRSRVCACRPVGQRLQTPPSDPKVKVPICPNGIPWFPI